MGFGDEVIASAQAKQINEATGRPVLIVGLDGRPRWSPMWLYNPRITQERYGAEVLQNGGNCRPYIAGKTTRKWIWREFHCEPGEIYFSEQEKELGEAGRGFILLEPHIKASSGGNKNWGWNRWEQLVMRLNGLPLGQMAPVGARILRGVTHIPTNSFRQACSVLATATAFVGGEGGLHHAAAAVDTPAVVIFGGFISPTVTGYEQQRNIFTGQGLGCGNRTPCQHCREAMARIAPSDVEKQLMEIV